MTVTRSREARPVQKPCAMSSFQVQLKNSAFAWEAILFAAARNDHVEELIKPALAAGSVVLCDRFMDSSRVYQGVTGNLPHDFVANLERVAINGTSPTARSSSTFRRKSVWRAHESASTRSIARPRLTVSRRKSSKRTRRAARPFSTCRCRAVPMPRGRCVR